MLREDCDIVSSLMDLPEMDVDMGNDGGNVLPEEASPLAEVGEFVDSDELEGGDGVVPK